MGTVENDDALSPFVTAFFVAKAESVVNLKFTSRLSQSVWQIGCSREAAEDGKGWLDCRGTTGAGANGGLFS
jgi:hypothetical protein